MHLERYERGIHAIRAGAHEASVTDIRFRCAPRPAAVGREPAAINSR
jgi:hypothetical protein